MMYRFTAAAAAAFACASVACAGGVVTGPGFDPDDPPAATFYEDAAAGTVGVGSTGAGLAALPIAPLGSTTYTTNASALNASVQGGISANGVVVPGQNAAFSKIGQVFNGVSGILNQLTFVDTNGAIGGEELRIQQFDPTSFAAVGAVLYSSSVAALTSYGDHSGLNGVDAIAYHTFAGIDLSLASGLQYYAYLVPTAGSQVFNGSNSRYQSGAYFFEGATTPSALGGALVFQFASNGEYRSVSATPAAGSIQALYYASITPLADVTGVPEPATWAMMVGGFGLVGAAMRRRTLVRA